MKCDAFRDPLGLQRKGEEETRHKKAQLWDLLTGQVKHPLYLPFTPRPALGSLPSESHAGRKEQPPRKTARPPVSVQASAHLL